MDPSETNSKSPADWVPAKPSAFAIPSSSRPRILPAATAAANVPQVPVVWKPLLKWEGLTALPNLMNVS